MKLLSHDFSSKHKKRKKSKKINKNIKTQMKLLSNVKMAKKRVKINKTQKIQKNVKKSKKINKKSNKIKKRIKTIKIKKQKKNNKNKNQKHGVTLFNWATCFLLFSSHLHCTKISDLPVYQLIPTEDTNTNSPSSFNLHSVHPPHRSTAVHDQSSLIFPSTRNSISWISNKLRNKAIKMKNGNRGGGIKQTIKVVHANLGSAFWENKITEIQNLILQLEPDLLFLSEANLRTQIPNEQADISGYFRVLPNTSISMNYSRFVLLVKEGVRIDIMDKCMSFDVPDIWVKAIHRGRKALVIGGTYREQHLLFQDPPNNTDEARSQLIRWRKTVDGWMKAQKDNKCIFIGDMNLDFSKWDQSDYRHQKLVKLVKDNIETLGFGQVISTMTRHWPGTPSSLVDHLWTNTPGCILAHHNSNNTPSDHNILTAILRSRDRKENSQVLISRDRKNLDLKEYTSRVQKIDWSDFFRSEDINELNQIFVEKLGPILDDLAPVKIHQVRNNLCKWMDDETKERQRDRDTKREIAKISGDPAHWKIYRTSRNVCTRELKKTKIKFYRKMYEKFENENDTKNFF